MLVALGASLGELACRTRTSGAAQSVTVHVDESPHPVIAAPYGLPPPPEELRRGPEPTWRITLSEPISLRACASTPLLVSATNDYDALVLTHRTRVSLKVNGAPAPAFDRVFQQGEAPPGWEAIPAHSTVRDERVMLGSLVNAPGEYEFALFLDGRRLAARRITVTP